MTIFGKLRAKRGLPATPGTTDIIAHDASDGLCVNIYPPSSPFIPTSSLVPQNLGYPSPPTVSKGEDPYRYLAGGAFVPQSSQQPQILSPNDGLWNQNVKTKSHTPLAVLDSQLGQTMDDGIGQWQHKTTGYLNQGAALCDLISNKFDAVITLIDGERFSGDERELAVYQTAPPVMTGSEPIVTRSTQQGCTINDTISAAVTSTNYFAKANLYANSRLPAYMPPLKLYMPTYPLLCLAAQYSQRVYTKPAGAERETHVDADWKLGTKAMVIKSVPIDDMNTVVFAVRGSQTFMDWAVNLNSTPATPEGFLDDPGNFCHSGFLQVARKMVRPVAARLRALLEEDPSRIKCSLLITGHSAGGAVASLLYAHMFAEDVQSELNILTGCKQPFYPTSPIIYTLSNPLLTNRVLPGFKRVHCITFGAPPVSLLPLQKPSTPRLRKSLFMSFVNEGDPVPRADKAYVRSLLDLYATPAPNSTCISTLVPTSNPPAPPPSVQAPKACKPLLPFNPMKRPKPLRATSAPAAPLSPIIWKVPPSTLSNAGRLVLLRGSGPPSTKEGQQHQQQQQEADVRACVTSDEQLRGVVFGDPVMHMMKVYRARVEVLATNAVMAKVVY
ncbi:MAG: hypothetical protein M1827_002637 [Pycnora praestabilis]|nr:MAG: hypothetical protein M1827_002637 [Pycnora praestabilis]